jgi:predicted N-acetyltransferase YhbS
MRIEELRRHPHLVDRAAATLHASWGSLPPWAEFGLIRERLLAGTKQAAFPRTLVAVTDEGEFAAMGSIKLSELPTHPEKVHWVGEIFVLPEHRGKGLGSRITQSLTEYAFSKGVSSLFLYTPDQQSLYRRLGWSVVSEEEVNAETVSIMRLSRCA